MNLSAKTVPGALQDVSRGMILIFPLHQFESFEPQIEGALAKPLSPKAFQKARLYSA